MASLNKSEFDTLVDLLARAHYTGDTGVLVYQAYDGLVKESGPPIQEMPAMSAMTDGSKRSLTPDAVESLEGFGTQAGTGCNS